MIETGLLPIDHYNDVIIDTIASQISTLASVYSAVYSGADQRKHQSCAWLAFVRGFHRGPVNSPHKWPVTRKMFPFDDVIMMARHIPFFVFWCACGTWWLLPIVTGFELYYYAWNIVSSHGIARYGIIYQEHLAICYCFVRPVYMQLITTCGNTCLRLNVLVFIRHVVYEFGSDYCISVQNSFQFRGWRGGTYHLIGWAMVTVWFIIATTATKWLPRFNPLDVGWITM